MYKVLVIVPAFNEEANILRVINNLLKEAPDYDYVVINDGSTDNTKSLCLQNDLNIVNLPVNLGIGGAMQTGYKYAVKGNYDIAIQMDGDGQHDPKYLKALVDKMISDHLDIVIGSRFIEQKGYQSTFTRRMGINILNGFIKYFARAKVSDCTSGFRACNKEVIHYFAKYYPKDYPEPESIMSITRENFSLAELPVEMNSREGGESSIDRGKSIYYMLKVIIAILLDTLKPPKRRYYGGQKQ